MKRGILISLLAVFLLCTACGKQAEQGELTRVLFARGHGSTWGNQFRIEICPTEVSYLHYFRDRGEFRELFAVPVEEGQWEQIETAAMTMLPQLEVRKPPGLLKRLAQALGPKEVDGGDWWSLTMTWGMDGESKDVQYIWTANPETEAFELLLEELARSVDQ